MNSKVLEAIKKSAAVPSMPQVVARFLEIMQDPGFSYADLVKVLSVDPGTVSEVLRLANSALFGVRNKVVSLRQAMTLLGPKRIRSLVLGRYLVDTISQKQTTSLEMSYFWRRSLASSVIASRFAERIFPRQRDEAFIAALLADIGVPIIAEAMPDRFGPIVEEYKPHGRPVTPQEELRAVDVTHSDVSSMVLSHWGLPETVCKAVNLQHSPNPGDDEPGRVARVLNAGDRIAKLLCEIGNGDEAVAICTSALDGVGVDVSVLVDLLPTIERDIEELAAALRIDVIPSKVYELLAKSVQEQLGTVTES